jgi:carboxypeptidase family protein/TonB-dependent receptor-like protein
MNLKFLALLAAVGFPAGCADLSLTVRDVSGATVPEAQAAVTHVETGIERRGQTNSDGLYRFAALPVGNDRLKVEKSGFSPLEREGITLQLGQVASLDVQLQVGTAQQQVDVTPNAPIVETDRTSGGAVVNRVEIEALPINGRNFLDFARTVAGVTAQQTSGRGSGLSFNGQRGWSNSIVVDGVDNNRQLNGNVRLTMSQDVIQEFQVITNQFARNSAMPRAAC